MSNAKLIKSTKTTAINIEKVQVHHAKIKEIMKLTHQENIRK